jgi:F0F1-type ATP synthase assembly protein I
MANTLRIASELAGFTSGTLITLCSIFLVNKYTTGNVNLVLKYVSWVFIIVGAIISTINIIRTVVEKFDQKDEQKDNDKKFSMIEYMKQKFNFN